VNVVAVDVLGDWHPNCRGLPSVAHAPSHRTRATVDQHRRVVVDVTVERGRDVRRELSPPWTVVCCIFRDRLLHGLRSGARAEASGVDTDAAASVTAAVGLVRRRESWCGVRAVRTEWAHRFTVRVRGGGRNRRRPDGCWGRRRSRCGDVGGEVPQLFGVAPVGAVNPPVPISKPGASCRIWGGGRRGGLVVEVAEHDHRHVLPVAVDQPVPLLVDS
jgi:hypothetical protein